MTATDLVLIALVLTAMAAVAAVDAWRAIVDPRLVLALVGSGLLWRLFGPADTGSLWSAVLGAALGVAVVAVPIAVAQLCRRRWPLFPGDAMMLGGLGFVLGPLALGWALLAGCDSLPALPRLAAAAPGPLLLPGLLPARTRHGRRRHGGVRVRERRQRARGG